MNSLKALIKMDDSRITGKFLLCFIALFLSIILGTYIYFFYGLPIKPATQIWGAFGDYIGGILNPFFSLIAIFLIYLTYRDQKKEIKEMGDALKKQNENREKEVKINQLVSLIIEEDKRLSKVPGVTSNNSDMWGPLPSGATSTFYNILLLLIALKNIHPESPLIKYYYLKLDESHLFQNSVEYHHHIEELFAKFCS